MARTIYKYPLSVHMAVGSDYQVDMPIGAEVISTGWNQGILVVWAIVDPKEQGRETRWFTVAGTGHPLGPDVDPRKLIGRIDIQTMAYEMLIFHVFEGRSGLDMTQKVSL
jgi:hypothetical protein